MTTVPPARYYSPHGTRIMTPARAVVDPEKVTPGIRVRMDTEPRRIHVVREVDRADDTVHAVPENELRGTWWGIENITEIVGEGDA